MLKYLLLALLPFQALADFKMDVNVVYADKEPPIIGTYIIEDKTVKESVEYDKDAVTYSLVKKEPPSLESVSETFNYSCSLHTLLDGENSFVTLVNRDFIMLSAGEYACSRFTRYDKFRVLPKYKEPIVLK
jgi:hypothetical protein